MVGELNQESRDLLYVGTNESLVTQVRNALPAAKILHITNYTDLKEYLVERRGLFRFALQVGKSSYQTMRAVYPAVILSEPEFPEFPDGSGSSGDGVSFLSQIKRFIPSTSVYLLLSDMVRGPSLEEVVQRANKEGIDVLEEREIRTRAIEFIGVLD